MGEMAFKAVICKGFNAFLWCLNRSESQPMYSWGALAGFIAIQEAGFYYNKNAGLYDKANESSSSMSPTMNDKL